MPQPTRFTTLAKRSAWPMGNEMSKPNRNGILECSSCGEMVHIKHATDGRCNDCDDRYRKEDRVPDEEEVDDEAVARVEHWDGEYAKFAPDSTERTK